MMTDTNDSRSSSSSLLRFPFRKKRQASKSGKPYGNVENMKEGQTTSTIQSNTEELLEPFQELVDEMNWDNISDGQFPLQDVSNDRPIASEAVAFVIRASRRGVVPLCAEVANLLKENASLKEIVDEQSDRLEKVSEENEMLNEKVKGPRPTLVDFGLQTVQENDCQTMTVEESSSQTDMLQISCIRNEDLQRLKMDVMQDEFQTFRDGGECYQNPTRLRFGGVRASCGADVILICSCSPLASTSSQNPMTISVGVNTIRDDCMDSLLGYFEHTSLEKSHRELEQKHLALMSKHDSVERSKEDIGSDLKSAKEEIVTLQRTIQEIQNKEYEKEREEEMLRRHESYSVDAQDTQATSEEWNMIMPHVPGSSQSQRHNRNKILPLLEASNPKSRLGIFPGPIVGCKCQMCMAFFRSSGILGFACSPYITDLAGRNPVLRDLKKLVWLQNTKLQVKPNDKVIARNNRMGHVRYVGHLDGVGNRSVVYVGLELENQDGRHDGYFNGRRYFVCRHKHGLFVPLEDILCVLARSTTEPFTNRALVGGPKDSKKCIAKGLKVSREENKIGPGTNSCSSYRSAQFSSCSSSTRSSCTAASSSNEKGLSK